VRALAVLAAAALASTGCATLTAPKTDILTVESNPPGANVVVNGQLRGQTPTTVELERGSPYPARVELQLPGYQPASCRTRMQAGIGYVIADAAICFFSLPVLYLGCLAFIDATGAWNELDTPVCSQTLQPALVQPIPLQPGDVPPPGYSPPGSPPPPTAQPGFEGLPPPPPPPQL